MPELVCVICRNDLLESDCALVCTACGQRYPIDDGVPVMLTEEDAEFQDEMAIQDKAASMYTNLRYREPLALKYHNWWTDKMLSLVRTDGLILDNGCGIGLLAHKTPKERILGLDLSRSMLKCAQTRIERLVQGNSQKLPFRDAVFDAVFCRSLLHHLPCPEAAIREMSRVLKPHGEIVLVDPNKTLLSTLPRLFMYRSDHFSRDHKNMKPQYLEELLSKYFLIEHVEYFGYLTYPLFGFPDILHISKYLPMKRTCYELSMRVDGILSRLPVLREQAWAFMVKAIKITG